MNIKYPSITYFQVIVFKKRKVSKPKSLWYANMFKQNFLLSRLPPGCRYVKLRPEVDLLASNYKLGHRLASRHPTLGLNFKNCTKTHLKKTFFPGRWGIMRRGWKAREKRMTEGRGGQTWWWKSYWHIGENIMINTSTYKRNNFV